MERSSGSEAIDVAAVLAELDRIHAAGGGPERARAHLDEALARSEELGDEAGRLAILNELMGHLRSVGDHARAVTRAEEALALADRMGLAGTDAYTTTLVNVATAQRAAGLLEQAHENYLRALADAERTLGPHDRRLAALHNNHSMLHSDSGHPAAARTELLAALRILEASSVDPGADVDIATTHTNLALVSLRLGRPEQAQSHAGSAMAIFQRTRREDGHYAGALASLAAVRIELGDATAAVELYRRALAIVDACYGPDSEAHEIVADNLEEAVAAVDAADRRRPTGGSIPALAPTHRTTPAARPKPGVDQATPREDVSLASGMELARAYWETHGRPMLRERYPAQAGRIAAGLVGHGSDALGFDDELSRDHDFGPGFCLWLTADDHAAIGEELQADYDALPATFRGVGPRVTTRRSEGSQRRVGVFEIGAFFSSLTGLESAPAADRPHEWLMLEEATLATATGGEVFVDPLGAFSGVRNSFRRMPEDVRLALIGRRLGMMAQAGQYNVPRMLARGDGEAAWLSVAEFVRATASVVFLLNRPAAVGYLPYYKWQFAALRALAARPASRLPDVHRHLADAVHLSSAACLGGAGFGEGGAGATPARAALEQAIDSACADVAAELRAQRLTDSADPFLERHRDEVQARIADPWLRAL